MKTCKKGLHQYEGKQCKECLKAWKIANAAILKTKRIAKTKANWHILRIKQRQSRDRNRETYLASQKKYRQNNRAKRTATQIKRQTSKLRRTPKWLTKLHFQQIELFYDAAQKLTKEFGIKMHVDHIVPLQGKYVSGLHVPWNLQVIPAFDNISKGNR